MQKLESTQDAEEVRYISLYCSEYLQEALVAIEQNNLNPECLPTIRDTTKKPEQSVDELIKVWSNDLKRKHTVAQA